MGLRFEASAVPSSQIAQTFEKLSKTAKSINNESDKLSKTVENLDLALRSLNLGVYAWVQFGKWSGENNRSGHSEIGYDKMHSGWGISLRTIEFDEDGLEDRRTEWTFNNAPRELRLLAIAYIPNLFEALNQKAMNIALELSEKNREIDVFADALGFQSGSNPRGTSVKSVTTKEAQ
jgi:hypothetical protein